MALDVSVCILTRDQPELLPRCVASCIREIEAAGLTGEVILVDNASTDGAPQRVAAQFPGVRVIRNEENRSFSTGNNQAIRESLGRLILMLNDDAILNSGSFALMVEALEADSQVAMVGPKLLNPDGSLQRGYTNRRFPRFRSLVCGLLRLNPFLEKRAWTRDLLTHSYDPERSGETDHLAGACLLARREALDSVGLFDENYYYWMEDADLCYRLREKGWKIAYLAQAQVTHHGSATLSKLMTSQRRTITTRAVTYYYQRHAGLPAYLLLKFFVSCVLLVYVPIDLVSALRRRFRVS